MSGSYSCVITGSFEEKPRTNSHWAGTGWLTLLYMVDSASWQEDGEKVIIIVNMAN